MYIHFFRFKILLLNRFALQAQRLYQTYTTHSGYCFRLKYDILGFAHAEGAIFHDFHHAVNRGNFGSPLMDWLFGTMDSFIVNGGFEGYVKGGRKPKQ
jgi:sterol desaturase/sphingolipid hydroxylase (fatty acid hydroxylase superfamily)